MLSKLKSHQGTYVVIELVDGRSLDGTLLEVNESILRLDTEAGVATMPVDSVKIIWENQNRSLAEEDMEEIVDALKDMVQTHWVCRMYACPPGGYVCLPPHVCAAFGCPGNRYIGGGTPCLSFFAGCFPRRRTRTEPPASCSNKTTEESSVDDQKAKE